MQGRRILKWGTVAVAAALVAACGGGGGNDDDNGGPPGSIDISAANREPITRAAMVTVQGGLIGGSLGIAGSAPATSVLGRWVRRAVAAGAGLAPREAAAGLIGPEQVDCAVSGSATLTLDDRDNNQVPSVGDVLSAVFTDCSDVAGETISGSMSAEYTEVVPSPTTVGANVTVTQLTAVEGPYSVRLDGAFALRLQQSSASVTTLRMVATNALALRAVTAAFNDTLTMQDGYRVDVTEDQAASPPGGGSPGRTATSVAGRLTSEAAGGWVTVSTAEPFVQYTDDEYPRSGAFEALGRNGSLQARALSSTQVRIDIDSNGDGTTDDTVTLPWTQLF